MCIFRFLLLAVPNRDFIAGGVMFTVAMFPAPLQVAPDKTARKKTELSKHISFPFQRE